MRAYELHAHAKTVNRSAGRSSVRAAAYRSGERLYEERTGQTHDYRAKSGVEHARLYAPEDAPEWTRNRAQLWNAAEAKENRKNSVTARELEIGFPAEFNAMQRREAGDAIARELVKRYNCAVDICYHQPGQEGDQRNHHAHVLFTTRGLDASRPDGWAATKYRELNNDRITVDGQATTRSAQELLSLRKFTAEVMNAISDRDRLGVTTEYLSFEARGVEKEPTRKLGPAASALERRGEDSERGDLNREIRASNDNRERLQAEKKVIDLEIEREKRRIAQENAKENDKWLRKIDRERHEALRRDLWEAKRELEIAQTKDFYHVERQRAAFVEASADLDRKTGLVQRITGQYREAQRHAEAMRLNLENAEARQAEALGAISKRYGPAKPRLTLAEVQRYTAANQQQETPPPGTAQDVQEKARRVSLREKFREYLDKLHLRRDTETKEEAEREAEAVTRQEQSKNAVERAAENVQRKTEALEQEEGRSAQIRAAWSPVIEAQERNAANLSEDWTTRQYNPEREPQKAAQSGDLQEVVAHIGTLRPDRPIVPQAQNPDPIAALGAMRQDGPQASQAPETDVLSGLKEEYRQSLRDAPAPEHGKAGEVHSQSAAENETPSEGQSHGLD